MGRLNWIAAGSSYQAQKDGDRDTREVGRARYRNGQTDPTV